MTRPPGLFSLPSIEPARAREHSASVFPAVLLVCASMLPPEVRITIADQTLFACRLVGFVLLPWAIYGLYRFPIRLRIWGAAIAITVFWMVFAFMAFYGPWVGFMRGVPLAIDVAIPYIIGRTSIRSLTDLRKFLLFVTPALALVGLVILIESASSQPLARPAAEAVFGPLPRYADGEAVGLRGSIEYERRLGLIRAAGPFNHPILAGLFMLSFLPLFLQSGNRGWPVIVGIIASFTGVLSLSSAALLVLLIGLPMVIADRIQRRTTFLSWRIMISFLMIVLLAMHFGTANGLVNVIGKFTLDPQTARFRELIWEYGTRSVVNHPWIGIGFQGYERPSWMISSVDNHWLAIAIRFGIIPSFFTFSAVILIIMALGRNAGSVPEVDRRFFVGIAIAVFSVTLMGFSVGFFGGFQTWYYAMLGCCASLASIPQRTIRREVTTSIQMGPLAYPNPATRS